MHTDKYQNLRRLLRALPAGIPHIGDVYTEYLSAKEMEDLRTAVTALDATSGVKLDRIAAAVGVQRSLLEQLIKSSRSSRSVESGINVKQEAGIIQNISGDLNIRVEGGKSDGGRNRR